MPLPEAQMAAIAGLREDRLYDTIATTLNVAADELNEESSPDTVASWDSLNHLNIVMAIEEEFGIGLTAEDAMEMRTIARIRTILREYGVDV